MKSILITGSSRGLGLEWARQCAQAGWRVYACCRHPSEASELQALAREHCQLSIHRLDVTQEHEIRAVADELREASIDVLLNNAGIYLEKFAEVAADTQRYEDWLYTFQVNTLGPVRVTEAFLDQVGRSERQLIATISSDMGSLARIESAGSYYYRSCKAALNAAMKGLAVELKPRGIGVLLLHPGWVATHMGGPGARYSPSESVAGMRTIIERFTLEASGRFLRFTGEEVPW